MYHQKTAIIIIKYIIKNSFFFASLKPKFSSVVGSLNITHRLSIIGAKFYREKNLESSADRHKTPQKASRRDEKRLKTFEFAASKQNS